MKRIGKIVKTDGRGLWTDVKKSVRIKDMDLFYSSPDSTTGELRVYFDKRYWDVYHHGLIYTDPQFLKEFRSILKKKGYPPRSVDYSEQGMQGWDYVSLDAGKSFVKRWYKSKR